MRSALGAAVAMLLAGCSVAPAAVRTYLLQDGQPHLSLFADSGNTTWVPTG